MNHLASKRESSSTKEAWSGVFVSGGDFIHHMKMNSIDWIECFVIEVRGIRAMGSTTLGSIRLCSMGV